MLSLILLSLYLSSICHFSGIRTETDSLNMCCSKIRDIYEIHESHIIFFSAFYFYFNKTEKKTESVVFL